MNIVFKIASISLFYKVDRNYVEQKYIIVVILIIAFWGNCVTKSIATNRIDLKNILCQRNTGYTRSIGPLFNACTAWTRSGAHPLRTQPNMLLNLVNILIQRILITKIKRPYKIKTLLHINITCGRITKVKSLFEMVAWCEIERNIFCVLEQPFSQDDTLSVKVG